MESRDLPQRSLGIGISCNDELQPEQPLVNTIELYWQDVQKEWLFITPSIYMHIWLGGGLGYFAKSNTFILSFDKN